MPTLRDLKKPNSYYDILNVHPCTSNKQVWESYSSLLQRYEREKDLKNKYKQAVRIRLLHEAYAALRTQESRDHYNRLLLSSRGKPKGMVLKADNDNKRNADQRLWNKFKAILKGHKNG